MSQINFKSLTWASLGIILAAFAVMVLHICGAVNVPLHWRGAALGTLILGATLHVYSTERAANRRPTAFMRLMLSLGVALGLLSFFGAMGGK